MPATLLTERPQTHAGGRGLRRIPAWSLVAPAQFAMAWGGNHFTPLLQLYEQRGHYSQTDTNLLLGTYVFGLVPGLLLAAALSEHYGRRKLMIAGLSMSLLGSIVLALGFPVFWLLCAGRVFAGLGVGVAMSVGTSWMVELSRAPHDRDATDAARVRRPALTMTLGFGIGAAVSGTLAQWAPWPTVLPYLVHITLCAFALPVLLLATETSPLKHEGHWWAAIRVRSVRDRRFRRVVLPTAPWVFGSAGIAYALLPELVEHRLGSHVLIFATLLCVLTLGCAVLVQPRVPALAVRTRGHALTVGMAAIMVGVVLALVSDALASPLIAVLAAPVLGCGFGVSVVAGLGEIQRIAEPRELAGMTGVYYCLTYLGFLLPSVLSAFSGVASYPVLLAVVAGVCGLCLACASFAIAHDAR